jgi:23S rRNA (uracil1939-C5)-methyltransferase
VTDEETLELHVEGLSAGGDAVGRDPGGRVVFVPLGAPGDRLRVQVTEVRGRFARGEIEAVLAAGPDRVEPRCPVFGSCGGCAWQHVAYPAQLAAKQARVRDALQRIARLDPPPAVEGVASPSPWGYRGRARVLVARDGVGFRRRRSRAVCPIRSCPLLAPALDRALAGLADDPRAARGEWELTLGEGDIVRALPLVGPGAGPESSQSAAAPLVVPVAGERIALSPGVFVQANVLLHDALAAAVLEAAGGGGVALELFAGAGFFTLGLARRFERVVAVESSGAAAGDLARNAAAAGLRHVRVIEARAEAWLHAGEGEALAPEVVVLDPPRGGVGAAAAGRVAGLGARRIVHVSCDPATFARDAAVLVAAGFRVARVRAFDLFPHTPHVETVALLERAGAGGG